MVDIYIKKKYNCTTVEFDEKYEFILKSLTFAELGKSELSLKLIEISSETLEETHVRLLSFFWGE